ncbi:MAG: carbohydrate porin [Caulobacteraceae bacterium]|nr:carbohydrate porin [Caulobacteraceae bacterium]
MGKNWILGAVFVAIIASATTARADPPTVTDPTKPAPPAALDKPKDAPPSPWSFTAAYTADLLDNATGGRAEGGGYADLLKFSAAYDGSAEGHDGLSGLISVTNTLGSAFTANRVGAVQSVSANEAQPRAAHLYEAWLQQDFFGGKGAVKAGIIDLNTTFDVQETAALFLNASDGAGADLGDTGLNGPSIYPIPALGATFVYRPTEDWTAQIGVFDGEAGDPAHRSAFLAVRLDGALLVGQIERRFGDTARLEAGAWTYTASFPSLTSFTASGAARTVHGNMGVYGLAEGGLMQSDSGKSLSGWVRLGFANGDINVVEDYLAGGLVYTGLVKGRDKDEVGIALNRAGLGAGARETGLLQGRSIGDAETTVEATYRYVVNDWLNLQPDMQYVIHPHGDRSVPDALVLGLRVALTYTK